MSVTFSVFTKPWKTLSVPDLATFIKDCGFDGIEFPVRTGFQVEPEGVEKALPELAKQLADYGLRIFSIAGSLDEEMFAGCAEAGVPLIRIMVDIGEGGYLASVERAKARLTQVLPLCQRYGVKVGVQQHYGDCISNSVGLLHLLQDFDPAFIGAIWDAAHDALAGMEVKHGLDVVWSRLALVNLKNAYYERTTGPEAVQTAWHRHFTTGRHGLSPWPEVARVLQNRGYAGTICLTAEYEEETRVDALIREDIAYAKSLWN